MNFASQHFLSCMFLGRIGHRKFLRDWKARRKHTCATASLLTHLIGMKQQVGLWFLCLPLDPLPDSLISELFNAIESVYISIHKYRIYIHSAYTYTESVYTNIESVYTYIYTATHQLKSGQLSHGSLEEQIYISYISIIKRI